MTITVYRPSTGEYLDLTMTRRVVETPTVEHQMLAGNLGYIEVSQFDSVTADQFKAAVDDLEAQNMAGLIIDLRGNPGGVLDAVVSMMDYILPDDIGNYSKTGGNTTLIYTEDKNGDGDCYAASDGHSVDVPIGGVGKWQLSQRVRSILRCDEGLWLGYSRWNHDLRQGYRTVDFPSGRRDSSEVDGIQLLYTGRK